MASRWLGEPYPLFVAHPYPGNCSSSSAIKVSRATLARTLAAATEAHVRSAFTLVVTGGTVTTGVRLSGCSVDCAGALSQSCRPSKRTASTGPVSCANARQPASRNAAVRPSSSTSAADACPTAHSRAHVVSTGTKSSRADADRSLLSRRPAGTVTTDASVTTTPHVAGPAGEPRPTSSTEARRRTPERNIAASSSNVGASDARLTSRTRSRRPAGVARAISPLSVTTTSLVWPHDTRVPRPSAVEWLHVTSPRRRRSAHSLGP